MLRRRAVIGMTAGRPVIEHLTGRGTAKTEHLAERWSALGAHDLLTGHAPD